MNRTSYWDERVTEGHLGVQKDRELKPVSSRCLHVCLCNVTVQIKGKMIAGNNGWKEGKRDDGETSVNL